MRTDVACHVDVPAVEVAATDAERGITLLADVFDVGAQLPQGVYEDADGAVAHAFRAGEHVLAMVGDGEEGGHETHGGA